MNKSPRAIRVMAWLITVSHLVTSFPLAAAQQPEVPQREERPPVAAPAREEAPERTIVPNRKVPDVASPAQTLSYSASPSDGDITRTRVFSEPLIPMPRPTTVAENRSLAAAILEYSRGGKSDQVAPLTRFLLQNPTSAWRASLWANLGTVYRANGYLSAALQAWNRAWVEAGAETEPRARAVGEWFDLSGKVGHVEEMQTRLDAIAGRTITGRAAQRVAMGREAVWVFTYHHEEAAASGPTALEHLLAYTAYERKVAHVPSELLQQYHALPAGTTLADLQELGKRVGLTWEMAFRPRGAELPIPSIVHLRADHYSALVKKENGRYLLLDPILGGEKWVGRDMLDQEGSGYVLAPTSALTSTWRRVSAQEATTVIGHCLPGAPDDTDPCCITGGGGSGLGMATYAFLLMPASLQVTDLPLTYQPPAGPPASFRLTYNQREGGQSQIFAYGNLGPKWTFDWLSWVSDDPNSGDVQASVYLRGGGTEIFHGGQVNGIYNPHWRTRAVLAKVSANPIRYERRLRDGGVEVFARSDGVITSGRRVYLTDVVDPQGLTLHFTYDAALRLVALTDASGLVTTLSYDLTSDPTKITKVTDPYGRFAMLTYNAAGQLASVTDALGLVSSFVYGTSDFLASLTTPYGTTLFSHEANPLQTNYVRFIQATDPLGGTERAEFRWSTTALSATASAAEVPAGFAAYNQSLDHYNSFYWDKRAMALYPLDTSKATVTHWLMYLFESFTPFYYSHGFSTSAAHSIKRPLENRVWYKYPGQGANLEFIGTWNQPTETARVLDDGSTQNRQATYNAQGQVTTQRDPLARQTSLTYASNGIDRLEVRQTTSGLNDRLASYATYNGQHLPQVSTDAAGQSTTYTYNAAGQPLTIVNAKGETTTYAYDADGRLLSRTAPLGATTTWTYDSYGRPRTVTEPDGYVVTTSYDAFDRPTRVSYPDGTVETLTYERLDLATRTDRLGRVTRFFHDPLRRLTATRDPAGRTVTQQWCTCGSLEKLIDAKGQTTTWERDAENRIAREVRADGTTATVYTYETTTSRLRTATDPKAQVTTYAYTGDDQVQQIAFSNASIATAAVSYTYDAGYPRLATMVDGTGTTSYAYHAPSGLGAGQVASVDGPLMNDTITYAYDELGRVVSRLVNGVGLTHSYDALGRPTQEVNPLGTFGYTYDGATARLATVAYPNGQTSTYSYFTDTNDHRLQTIHHKYPSAATLSKFDYTYDAVGNIVTWRQQADATAVQWAYAYDGSDQLIAATKTTTDATPVVLTRYGYGFDTAGNRTVEQIDDVVRGSTYDALNRLTALGPGGRLSISGQLNEPASVTVNGTPMLVTADNLFNGAVLTTPGTNTLTVTAIDGAGNQAVKTYELNVTGANTTVTYDANGNLTSDGSRTFEWDARNQLMAVSVGTHRSEFTYDGQRTPVRIVDYETSQLISDTRFIWNGNDVAERRSSDGQMITARSYEYGLQDDGVARYLTRDHLASVREVTNQAGVSDIRYAYSPFGSAETVVGQPSSLVGFTGALAHAESGLNIMHYRAYDPGTGHWLSEDPIGLKEGPNLYHYVGNNPLKWFDPAGTFRMVSPDRHDTGRQDWTCTKPANPLNISGCYEKCCVEHDSCYSKIGCTETTWKTLLTPIDACDLCNWSVVLCIVSANPMGHCESSSCPSGAR